MKKQNQLLEEMVAYDSGDPKRIQHFLKVYSFAKLIGEQEGLDARTQEILETAAIVHDIGIKNAEKLYHSASSAPKPGENCCGRCFWRIRHMK